MGSVDILCSTRDHTLPRYLDIAGFISGILYVVLVISSWQSGGILGSSLDLAADPGISGGLSGSLGSPMRGTRESVIVICDVMELRDR